MSANFKATGKLNGSEQAVGITIYVTALIAEYCNLDQVALEDHGTTSRNLMLILDVFRELKAINPDVRESIHSQTAGTDEAAAILRTPLRAFTQLHAYPNGSDSSYTLSR